MELSVRSSRTKRSLFLVGLLLVSRVLIAEIPQPPPKPEHDPAIEVRSRRLWEQNQKSLVFPCDVNKANKPHLILSGENHESPIYKADACNRLEKAADGKCFVGLEGIYCKDPVKPEELAMKYGAIVPDTSHVAGYDDSFTHGIGLIMRQTVQLKAAIAREDKGKAKEAKGDFILNAFNQDFVKEAWGKLKKENPFKAEPEKKIAQILDAAFASGKEAEVRERVLDLSNENPWNSNDDAFANVLNALLLSFVDMAESPKYKKTMLVPDDLRPLIKDFIADKNLTLAIQILNIQWRNQFLARNIAEMYCKAMAQGKDLHIIVGKRHLKGLEELLSKMSAGQVIPVERDFEGEVMATLAKLNEQRVLPGMGGGRALPHALPGSGGRGDRSIELERAVPVSQFSVERAIPFPGGSFPGEGLNHGRNEQHIKWSTDELKKPEMKTLADNAAKKAKEILSAIPGYDEKKISVKIEPTDSGVWISVSYPTADLRKSFPKEDELPGSRKLEEEVGKLTSGTKYKMTARAPYWFGGKYQEKSESEILHASIIGEGYDVGPWNKK